MCLSRASLWWSGPCLNRLVNNVKFNFRDTLIDDAYSFRSCIRDIDSSSSNERTAVIDPNGHGTSISDVCYAQPGAEGQAGVRSRQFARIKFFATRGLLPLRVTAGNSLRGHPCPGRTRVRHEVLFRIRAFSRLAESEGDSQGGGSVGSRCRLNWHEDRHGQALFTGPA